ncbi:MAG: hypothetical protein JW725_02670 [Candidatus Babeliaceae bacterium]|nr:hypothetical protein [Candidatus Babeliaceae bacterium]
MLKNNNYATIDEFVEFVRQNWNEKFSSYGQEWSYAISSGWDDVEFERLYNEYVQSTQIELKPEDDATELKGRPLEKIAHYFLEKGGVVKSIKEISDHQKWQVDGQGPLNTTALVNCWGEEIFKKLGIQLYMEAKNHSDPVTNEEFSVHFRRMEEHDCYLGVLISTSGYKIGRGLGIAESIHRHYWRNRFHLLLVFQSISAVKTEGKAPLAVLAEALCHALNNRYVNDADVQKFYSQEACHKAARSEFERIFSQ